MFVMELSEARQLVSTALDPKRQAVVIVSAKTDAEAKAIRALLHEAALEQAEPVEINILGREPHMEVWVRKLTGGRPTVFMCSCGYQGTEAQVGLHRDVSYNPVCKPRKRVPRGDLN